MKYGNYYVSSVEDNGIERENPETSKTEICKGYYCQVFRDREYQDQVDDFCLAVGHEIPDLSDASLAAGICEYLGLSHTDDYLHQIETAFGETTKTSVLFSDILPHSFAKELDTHFAEQGWQLQTWRIGNKEGYQVFFGEGVQVDNLFEYGFPYLYDEEELTCFAETFYKAQILGEAVNELPAEEMSGEMNVDTSGHSIPGHIGTWHTIDHIEVDGHTFWLMEHDIYGDAAANVIVDDHGQLVLTDVFNGFDAHTVELLCQEVLPVDKLPDESITVEQMKEYGYAWGGMLPMMKDAALKLWKTKACPIYRLFKDDSESMIMDIDELREHIEMKGIFGVEKVDWLGLTPEHSGRNFQHNAPSLDTQISKAAARASTTSPSAPSTFKDLDLPW